VSGMARYFEISCNDDGEICVHSYTTKAEFEAKLARAAELGEPAHEFAASVPGEDPQYWGGKRIVIKGEIVVPAAREVVKTWEVP